MLLTFDFHKKKTVITKDHSTAKKTTYFLFQMF